MSTPAEAAVPPLDDTELLRQLLTRFKGIPFVGNATGPWRKIDWKKILITLIRKTSRKKGLGVTRKWGGGRIKRACWPREEVVVSVGKIKFCLQHCPVWSTHSKHQVPPTATEWQFGPLPPERGAGTRGVHRAWWWWGLRGREKLKGFY